MVDERVRAAIKNWAPRFIAQGVDYNDFFRTTVRVEKWEDWCRELCSTGDVEPARIGVAGVSLGPERRSPHQEADGK